METHAMRLQAAFESRDLPTVLALMDERVLWRGLPQPDGERPMCQSRDDVRGVLEAYLARGSQARPIVIAEVGDSVVVDPRAQLATPFPLHQVFTFRGGRIVLVQDYPDRTSAMDAVGS